jgi:hypothetical protein
MTTTGSSSRTTAVDIYAAATPLHIAFRKTSMLFKDIMPNRNNAGLCATPDKAVQLTKVRQVHPPPVLVCRQAVSLRSSSNRHSAPAWLPVVLRSIEDATST